MEAWTGGEIDGCIVVTEHHCRIISTPKALNKVEIQRTSLVRHAKARCLASSHDRETVFYFLQFHETRESSIETQCLAIECLVSKQFP